MTMRNKPVEIAECRKGIIHAGEQAADDRGEQRSGHAVRPAGRDRERAASQHGKRHGRGRQSAGPWSRCGTAMLERVRCEDERKLLRIATIGDRLAQKPAILHDVDEIAQPDDETGDRDVGPAGIRVQRRLDFIKRSAQRIRFLFIATALFEPPRDPCADLGNAR